MLSWAHLFKEWDIILTQLNKPCRVRYDLIQKSGPEPNLSVHFWFSWTLLLESVLRMCKPSTEFSTTNYAIPVTAFKNTCESNAHWAKKPKKAFAIHLLTLLMTLSPSLCSLSFLTSSPSLSMTLSDHRVLSQPWVPPIYLNKLSLDGSLHANSSNLGV